MNEEDIRDEYERMLSAAFRRLVKMDRLDAALPLLDAVIVGIDTPSKSPYSVLQLSLGAEAFDAFNAADWTEATGWDSDREEEYTYRNEGTLYRDVFETVIWHDYKLGSVSARIRLDPVEAGWREAAYASLQGGTTNQANLVSKGAITYNGRFYRSHDETLVARELDRRSILYFPLPSASRGGVLKEPDIVVVFKGRIGIIEVDGAYHTGRAADDHKRDVFGSNPSVGSTLRHDDEAEDIAQQTLPRALERWPLPPGQDVARWLAVVGLWLAIDERRRRRLWGLLPIVDSHQIWAMAADPDLWTALSQLDRRTRAALVMTVLDGYTQDEVADALGVPRGTVASWLARGRARLRAVLADRLRMPTSIRSMRACARVCSDLPTRSRWMKPRRRLEVGP